MLTGSIEPDNLQDRKVVFVGFKPLVKNFTTHWFPYLQIQGACIFNYFVRNIINKYAYVTWSCHKNKMSMSSRCKWQQFTNNSKFAFIIFDFGNPIVSVVNFDITSFVWNKACWKCFAIVLVLTMKVEFLWVTKQQRHFLFLHCFFSRK